MLFDDRTMNWGGIKPAEPHAYVDLLSDRFDVFAECFDVLGERRGELVHAGVPVADTVVGEVVQDDHCRTQRLGENGHGENAQVTGSSNDCGVILCE